MRNVYGRSASALERVVEVGLARSLGALRQPRNDAIALPLLHFASQPRNLLLIIAPDHAERNLDPRL